MKEVWEDLLYVVNFEQIARVGFQASLEFLKDEQSLSDQFRVLEERTEFLGQNLEFLKDEQSSLGYFRVIEGRTESFRLVQSY